MYINTEASRLHKEKILKESRDDKRIAEQEAKYAKEIEQSKVPLEQRRAIQIKIELAAFNFQRKQAEAESPRRIAEQENKE